MSQRAALAALGFITSALQLLVAHVIGSPRGQELGKAGMMDRVPRPRCVAVLLLTETVAQ